mmetsp:Transcript_11908/g.17058  ORF Transcript_11908/g.17058 Transcript_11908/m.17058 type:complete len:387 (-) Transcript_11908:587-1747(-)
MTIIPHQKHTTKTRLSYKNHKNSTAATSIPILHINNNNHNHLTHVTKKQIVSIRNSIIEKLLRNGGNLKDDRIQSGISILQSFFLSKNVDVSYTSDLKGTWLTLSKPTFSECLGQNQNGDHVYSLGRMSFDMFRPTSLICSIQGIFNTIHSLDDDDDDDDDDGDNSNDGLPISVPIQLRKEILKYGSKLRDLRACNVVVAFTIEPGQSRSGKQTGPLGCLLGGRTTDHHQKTTTTTDTDTDTETNTSTRTTTIQRPIRGIMTNFGYVLPDPGTQNRLSIWFTGGSLEVNDEEGDLEEWRHIFDAANMPDRDMGAFARVLAAKVLLGAEVADAMDENGNLSYRLKRPIGGHGSAFSDVVYMDERLRIMRGHQGSMYVFERVPVPKSC